MRSLPREVEHLELLGLYPAPPPPRVEVHLLHPLALHLLPHLDSVGAGEVHLVAAGADPGVLEPLCLGHLAVPLVVVMPQVTTVAADSDTVPILPPPKC